MLTERYANSPKSTRRPRSAAAAGVTRFILVNQCCLLELPRAATNQDYPKSFLERLDHNK